jgi:predicted glutamine amidotransferase
MCRLVGWVSHTPVTLEDVLGSAAVARLAHLSQVHADGWGAGWYDEHGVLTVTRSDIAARTDERFAAFAHGVASTAAIVHLRMGTPGFGHGTLNNHPFTDGRWAFAHNGAIGPGERIDLLLDDTGPRPAGQTDSERYFLALRANMTLSVPSAVDHVITRMTDVGLSASSLNAMLLGPDTLHVISSHDAAWQAPFPVWPADELAAGVVAPPYFPLSYREKDDTIVAVSSGIVSNLDGWAAMPNDVVLEIDLATRRTGIAALSGGVR